MDPLKGASAVGVKLASPVKASDNISKISDTQIKAEIKKINQQIEANQKEVGRLTKKMNKSNDGEEIWELKQTIKNMGEEGRKLLQERSSLQEQLPKTKKK